MSLDLKTLTGIIERITYHNKDNGYCVFRLKTEKNKTVITVIGTTDHLIEGQDCTVKGTWVENKEYGRQFSAATLETTTPHSLEGIQKVLSSGIIKGIGPHYASILVKAFGSEIFDVIEKEPEKIFTIPKLGHKRAEMVVKQWTVQKVIRSIMVFLRSHGVSGSSAIRIYKTYGDQSIEIVRNNPYRLAKDIIGIGFKSADMIAQSLGIEKTSLDRAKAGIEYLLLQQTQQGHCAYLAEKLIEETEKLLEIPTVILRQGLEILLKEGHLVFEKLDEHDCIYLKYYYQIEVHLASTLMQLRGGHPPWTISHIEQKIDEFQRIHALNFSKNQKQAIQNALTHKITIITGGPGTGKSTLTKAIVSILKSYNMRILLCSPTGKAAKRLSECTGIEAKTIHRLLKFDPQKKSFQYHEKNPLPADLLLIDEVSMLDITLAYRLLSAVDKKTVLIFIGDKDQLPSVGPGKFLEDLIDSQQFSCIFLTDIFRQTKGSRIIECAHNINQGIMPSLQHEKKSDFYFIESSDPEKISQQICELVSQRIPKAFGFHPIKHIQVLCPMQRGIIGARHLNQALQKTLNPHPSAKITVFETCYGVGDKILVVENDYEKDVYNGDHGIITSIDPHTSEVTIFFDEKEVIFSTDELDIIHLAYTTTVHKSQGSEYPVVIIPVCTSHYMMLQRNLLYTAITRGKKLVICIGQKKAFYIAIQNYKNKTRWTYLKQRLISYIPKKVLHQKSIEF